MTVLAAALIIAGVAFLAVSVLGVVRFPDFYTRAHAVAKAETLGILLVLAGLALHHGWAPGTPQILLVLVFALFTNPTALHALARAAYRTGVGPVRAGERESAS